jgi:3-hydroxyisobutyrate dehydrogenase-like beta-hydroxyacid dehydrogenase
LNVIDEAQMKDKSTLDGRINAYEKAITNLATATSENMALLDNIIKMLPDKTVLQCIYCGENHLVKDCAVAKTFIPSTYSKRVKQEKTITCIYCG